MRLPVDVSTGFKISFQEHHLGKEPQKIQMYFILFIWNSGLTFIIGFPEPVFTKICVKYSMFFLLELQKAMQTPWNETIQDV